LKNYELALDDHKAGMSDKDIAEKYGVTLNTVKSWKRRNDWPKKGTLKKKGAISKKGAEKVVKNIVIDSKELSEDEQLFCIYYLKYHNQVKAYQRIRPSTAYASACVTASRWMKLERIKEEITRLKKDMYTEAILDPQDIVQKYIDIAFADMTDFVEFKGSSVGLRNFDDIDGTLVTEIKKFKGGVSIKLADRMKALDWLSKNIMLGNEEQKDQYNNFIEALNGTASEDWDEYEE